MTIYDSKEDVIETILPQSGFLSLGLLMITEYLIASGFVNVAELRWCVTVSPGAMF